MIKVMLISLFRHYVILIYAFFTVANAVRDREYAIIKYAILRKPLHNLLLLQYNPDFKTYPDFKTSKPDIIVFLSHLSV